MDLPITAKGLVISVDAGRSALLQILRAFRLRVIQERLWIGSL